MENRKTPKPGSPDYNPENTKDLNIPKYNSSTDRRDSTELPATENLNDELTEENEQKPVAPKSPKTNLGNGSDKDPESEKLITP